MAPTKIAIGNPQATAKAAGLSTKSRLGDFIRITSTVKMYSQPISWLA